MKEKGKELHPVLKKNTHFHLFFRLKYPKLLTLIFIILISYFVFQLDPVNSFLDKISFKYAYISSFIAGLLLPFGFTAPFAAGVFINLIAENILLATVLGGIGGLISDMVIFKIIRLSFMDEFEKLEHTKMMEEITYLLDTNAIHRFKMYIIYALAGLMIASPLPDEAGVAMLAGMTRINAYTLAILSFALHALGIYILLLI